MIIYVLHERGAESHYRALIWGSKQYEGINVKFREFSIFRKSAKSILKMDFELLKKQFINIAFLINLMFTSNKVVIIGIAPYDWRLMLYYSFFKKHKYYYHTSQTSWDYTNYAKRFLSEMKYSKDVWRNFINNAIGVFCVSRKTADEITKYYNPKKISIVNHSIEKIYESNKLNNKNHKVINCLFVGRLWQIKGITLIFEIIKNLDPAKFNFGFVGTGEMEADVRSFIKNRSNCKYYGYLTNPLLRDIYDMNDVLLIPSLKMGDWEEFFGMVLIEGMARGVIPLATNHSGPIEIIKDKHSGYLFNEINYVKNAEIVLNNLYSNNGNLKLLQENAFKAGQCYKPEEIFKKWNSLLSLKYR
ncbi:glycosyltransferase family 4 protein [Leeuwenhoekiella sp. A16]|uniref:glycosyltransferase family 4 protein n=1 Tax=unclassified Leeuwenhoekiella TaxID=2615029 RepID=UPI003A80C69F